MTTLFRHFRWAAFVVVLTAGCASSAGVGAELESADEIVETAVLRLDEYLNSCRPGCSMGLDPQSAVDTVYVSPGLDTVFIGLNDAFAQIPFRDTTVRSVVGQFREVLGVEFDGIVPELFVRDQPISELVPNIYRTGEHEPDIKRRPSGTPNSRQHVINSDRPIFPTAGLSARHIAVWPSHGWYYESSQERWEWQRSRLFQTVEDLLPMSFITSYLAPMLERAGARVYIPRERDPQHREVIVDNDDLPEWSSDGQALPVSAGVAGYAESDSLGPWYRIWETAEAPGYSTGSGILHGAQNPFAEGTYRTVRTDSVTTASSAWLPDIPANGRYSVYISYGRVDNPAPDARYTVTHLGGQTSFIVDQTMGPGTWTYLGTFPFETGANIEHGLVTLENESAFPGTNISGDGVRFGGGMGNIVRGQSVSGRPRFTEGARYYMQFNGMPDTLVYNVTESLNDYVDDYRGRAEWVNYLRGAPSGPNKNRNHRGLGIPIDLSLAFHTDAGITPDSTTIGTLMIYSSTGYESEGSFPDGMSRAANRDFGDIMQTQIVNDIRALHDASWTRRSLWNRDYSEAVRPNIPGVLLELQSHQNFADMKFALDPAFRFDVSRAIYKAMLRFLANQDDRRFVVQPLQVRNLSMQWIDADTRSDSGSSRPGSSDSGFSGPGASGSGNRARLRWQETTDQLEPSADATGYIVYRRDGPTGFDNGTYSPAPEWVVDDLIPGVVTSFRVSAVNDGGESRASSVISLGIPSDDQLIRVVRTDAAGTVLVVDNFDRVSGPGILETDHWKGFMSPVDEGVPDGTDVSYVGDQYDFDPSSVYIDDDAPGHGASYATFETWPRIGNTRDYSAIHGEAILAAGYSFLTTTGAAVQTGQASLSGADVVDFLLGEQRRTAMPGGRRSTLFPVFDAATQTEIRQYLSEGGRLFVSGAYVGTDLVSGATSKEDRAFAKDVLKFKFQTDHASQTGKLVNPANILTTTSAPLQFNVDPRSEIYRVESPDAITPSKAEGETLLRYAENGSGAAIGDRSGHPVVVFGFPFETLAGTENRNAIMASVLLYLTK